MSEKVSAHSIRSLEALRDGVGLEIWCIISVESRITGALHRTGGSPLALAAPVLLQ